MKINHDIGVIIFTAKISEWQYKYNNCVTRLWRELVQQKCQSDNTNKIIVSQDFGENKYSKNNMIMYIINDKFWWIY